MVFGFGKKLVTSTPQEAPKTLFPNLTAAQVQQAVSSAPRAERFSAGGEWGDIAPSLLFAAQQFDGVWACCCGHVNGLVHYAGRFPFKVFKCAKCMQIVCKHCQKTTSDILTPCDYEEICYDLRKLTKKGEEVQLVKVCSRCGLSHCAVKYKDMMYFPQECYCSKGFGDSSLCFRLGTADDFRRDPVGAEDLAKQKWADAMVVKDYGRLSDKNRRKRNLDLQVISETRKRHGKAKLRNQVDRLADRQKLQQEEPRPATAPTTRAPRPLRVHTDHEDHPPQYAQLRPKATRFEPYNPQQVEWMPLVGEPMTPSFQLHLSLGHEDRSVMHGSSFLEQSADDNHWPPLSPAMRTAPLLSEFPQSLRIGISVSQHPSAYGQSLRPDTARSVTWDNRDMQSTSQPQPHLDRRVETEYVSGAEHERLNEGAHDFLKSTLGTAKYESLNGREKSEMIETVRVALHEDFQLLKLRDHE